MTHNQTDSIFPVSTGTVTACQAVIVAMIQRNLNRMANLDAEEEAMNSEILRLQAFFSSKAAFKERSVWRHPASTHWWEHVLPNLPEEIFIAHFRVDRITFDWIVAEVHDDMFTKDTMFRNATPVQKKVAVSLKCLATTCDVLTIAALFGIGRSSVHSYFKQFINIMNNKIVPRVIKFPSSEMEFHQLSSEFESFWGFPMAIGAIDGTHIPFNPPIGVVADFHNYKGWNSIMTLGICDAKGRAIWLKSGIPGSKSDSEAFKATEIYKKISNQQLIPRSTREILTNQIPYLILGDAGFALESWLLIPFTHHSNLMEQHKIFNYRHSRAQKSAENMFGRVKLRWRRLLRGLDVKYETANKVINVAFALHNICETNAIECQPTVEEQHENNNLLNMYPQPAQIINGENFNGLQIRQTLMQYFNQQPQPWT